MSPLELKQSFQDELDRYNSESQLLAQNEWLAPPSPRSRARRIDPKQFNAEHARELKRWNQVSSLLYGHTTSSLRKTDVTHPREVYFPGVIFSAPIHTSSSSDEKYVMYDDPNLTATPFGTVWSKYRKMIVLRVFGEHCICLPIYTHNGQGLEGKEFTKEFVSIRDIAARIPVSDEGPYMGIRAVRDTDYSGTFIEGKACVKLSELYSHRYEAQATIEGKLDTLSFSKGRLLELVNLVNGYLK
ncbi:hypothetical protein F4677DRAFT_462251 [Hypoxylon crocopeplum]|nr:hypothetical protein F4677DRAFT_462251 [Hypoxylon crocopeplum]